MSLIKDAKFSIGAYRTATVRDTDPDSPVAQQRRRLRAAFTDTVIFGVGSLASIAVTTYEAINNHPVPAVVAGTLAVATAVGCEHYLEKVWSVAGEIPRNPTSN